MLPYKSIVKRMIPSYKRTGVNKSSRIKFVHDHLNFHSENYLGAYSDEHDGKFHQDTPTEKVSSNVKGIIDDMLVDFC